MQCRNSDDTEKESQLQPTYECLIDGESCLRSQQLISCPSCTQVICSECLIYHIKMKITHNPTDTVDNLKTDINSIPCPYCRTEYKELESFEYIKHMLQEFKIIIQKNKWYQNSILRKNSLDKMIALTTDPNIIRGINENFIMKDITQENLTSINMIKKSMTNLTSMDYYIRNWENNIDKTNIKMIDSFIQQNYKKIFAEYNKIYAKTKNTAIIPLNKIDLTEIDKLIIQLVPYIKKYCKNIELLYISNKYVFREDMTPRNLEISRILYFDEYDLQSLNTFIDFESVNIQLFDVRNLDMLIRHYET